MNYHLFSDQDLHQKTKNLASDERELTLQVIHCLKEVEARRLFAQLGFSSLYEFCIKDLGYSEGAAHRRISAMRLLRGLSETNQKETEEKILSGNFSLSNLSLVQGFLRTEKKVAQKNYTASEKDALLKTVEQKSKREVEMILAEIQPAMIIAEKERPLGNQTIEIKFIASAALMEKLNRIKNLTAHSDPNPTYAALFEKMADLMLAKVDPEMKKNKSSKTNSSSFPVTKASTPVQAKPIQIKTSTSPERSTPPPATPVSRTRYIPSVIKQEVWLRDRGQCTYQNPKDNSICSSRYGLEFDHVRPFSKGGENTIENLRLRCRQHNLVEAEKMGLFIYRPKEDLIKIKTPRR